MPRLLLVQGGELEQPTDTLLLPDVEVRSRLSRGYSGSSAIRDSRTVNLGRQTYKDIWVCQIFWLWNIVSDFSLDQALGLEEQSRLGVLKDHLQ